LKNTRATEKRLEGRRSDFSGHGKLEGKDYSKQDVKGAQPTASTLLERSQEREKRSKRKTGVKEGDGRPCQRREEKGEGDGKQAGKNTQSLSLGKTERGGGENGSGGDLKTRRGVT